MGSSIQTSQSSAHPVCEYFYSATVLLSAHIHQGFFNSLFTAGFLESSPNLSSSLSGTQDIDIVFDDRNITRAGTSVASGSLPVS